MSIKNRYWGVESMSQRGRENNRLEANRLLIVSNRLPITLMIGEEGHWRAQPSSGGLVTALTAVLKRKRGVWIGWPGIPEELDLGETIVAASRELGYMLEPVWLTRRDIDQYYLGFSNEIMWPLFHDIQSRCNFDPAYWHRYKTVNRKFAQNIVDKVGKEDFIWVQDYHLMLVAKELRRMGVESKIGFFLHIPFPNPDMYMKLPWRKQILAALLQYDLIGFQTRRDRNNFIHCIEAMFKGIHVDTRKQVETIKTFKHEVTVGSFPISIDFQDFARRATSTIVAERAKQLHSAIPNCQIILGIDRLDYSKGIPERLRGLRNFLERFSTLRGKVTLVQVVVPSREDIPEYRALRNEIEGLVNSINDNFTQPEWMPIQYIYRSLERTELLAYYRASEIALITPLKDGMNLVSKEYCTANIDETGVLILSEFAGAASQLGGNSLLVNPYDVEGIANAIKRAYHMSAFERQWRMRRLRKSIAKRDIFWWANYFLESAYG